MAAPVSLYTPLRIIKTALKDCGRLQIGSEPSSEVIADALERMSDLINAWQTQGLKLWLNRIQSIVPEAGIATYTLGPSGAIMSVKPTRVLEGWRVQASGVRTPLNLLAWNQYYNLGNLSTSGTPNSFFVDKQARNLAIHFWPVPDAVTALGTIELLLQEQAQAPTSLDETVAFPVEWYLALRWGLSDELATGQPAIIMERCANKAAAYRSALEDWDVEDASTLFQPNTLMSGAAPSRFR
jgi:hypothetical protein